MPRSAVLCRLRSLHTASSLHTAGPWHAAQNVLHCILSALCERRVVALGFSSPAACATKEPLTPRCPHLAVRVQVVDEIVQLLTETRFAGKMVVILAGYDAQVEGLMATNPGLKSRFSGEAAAAAGGCWGLPGAAVAVWADRGCARRLLGVVKAGRV